MSGGYIRCGGWEGCGKTGTAFFDVLIALEEDIITVEEQVKWNEFEEQLHGQLEELDEDDLPDMDLSRSMLELLIPWLERYFTILNKQLGEPDPESWQDIGEWKCGEGWQLMCVDDLIRAYNVCCQSGETVHIFFD